MESFPKIPDPVILEHKIAELMADQKTTGWPFDIKKAQELENTLLNRLEELRQKTYKICSFVPGNLFTPKRNNKTQGYYEGAEMQRLKDFNPSSREHIAWWFKTFQKWNPTKLTATGKAVIDEVVLKEIGTKEALIFLEILETQKKLGMLSHGQNAWLKLVKDGRLHHSCFIGAATHRMAHSHPNLAQVSSDKDCRELFITKPGWKLVDSDLAGIELRMFAHYLARYDGGRYAKILLNDDIHQVNADKIGISRRQVKTVTYAFLYGAGNLKLGLSYDNSLQPSKASKKGQEIRKAFVSAINGLADLLAAVSAKATNGWLLAIDGRRVLVDSPHKALNYLLQCSAGVVAKRWMVIANDAIHNPHTHQLAFVHDELQYETPPEDAVNLGNLLEESAKLAGEYYNLRCPIAAESKQGKTWADVH